METQNTNEPQVITIRPAALFAFIHVFPMILCTIGLLLMAWWLFPGLIWLALVNLLIAGYRYIYIRKIIYLITPELIRISRGIFFKRADQVEMYRVKDYVITRPFFLQLFRLMDVTLKTTDPENRVIWFRGIPLSDLVDTIREHVQEARQHNRIYEIN